MNRNDFDYLTDSEFKLLANTCAHKKNKAGITKQPYNGDGFKGVEERNLGYKNLKKHGLIDFEENKFKKDSVITHADITLLVDC